MKTLSKLSWILLLAPALAGAQYVLPESQVLATNTGLGTVLTVICTVASWAFYILMALTVVFIIWAAFKYLTAGGESEKVQEANHMIIYAVVAVVVAIVAKYLPRIVAQVMGSQVIIPPGC